MIIDLKTFIGRERPFWDELEGQVARIEAEPAWKLDLEQARRLHYLYERAASGLDRISTFSSDPDVLRYLESLVGRAYGLIHAADRERRFHPVAWFFGTFPRTFRKHIQAFALAAAITVAGAVFGAAAVGLDPEAKGVLIPFEHLKGSPADRVHREEQEGAGHEAHGPEGHTSFASGLMTHNISVSFYAFALGLTWGVGTIVLLFYNGVILGAVMLDYIRAGQSVFLAGWLLPHGSIEIPAILLAGQAAFVVASALIGRSDPNPLKLRLRRVGPDVVTLVFGLAIMLVWAGIVESFFSQYHYPVLPYWLKIMFGFVELVLLTLFLALAGRGGGNDSAKSKEGSIVTLSEAKGLGRPGQVESLRDLKVAQNDHGGRSG